MTNETNKLFYEGMDWKELRESDIITKIATKTNAILGPELYKDCLYLGVRPQEVFAETYLSHFMHRIKILDDWEGEQEFLSPMGSNPEGAYKLSAPEELPDEIKLKYAISKRNGCHIEIAAYSMLDYFEKEQYEVMSETLSRTEIVTILRLNLYFRSASPENQIKWLDAQIKEYELQSGEKIE